MRHRRKRCSRCHFVDWESARTKDGGYDWGLLGELFAQRRRHQTRCSNWGFE